jgi:hypothetical protein
MHSLPRDSNVVLHAVHSSAPFFSFLSSHAFASLLSSLFSQPLVLFSSPLLPPLDTRHAEPRTRQAWDWTTSASGSKMSFGSYGTTGRITPAGDVRRLVNVFTPETYAGCGVKGGTAAKQGFGADTQAKVDTPGKVTVNYTPGTGKNQWVVRLLRLVLVFYCSRFNVGNNDVKVRECSFFLLPILLFRLTNFTNASAGLCSKLTYKLTIPHRAADPWEENEVIYVKWRPNAGAAWQKAGPKSDGFRCELFSCFFYRPSLPLISFVCFSRTSCTHLHDVRRSWPRG